MMSTLAFHDVYAPVFILVKILHYPLSIVNCQLQLPASTGSPATKTSAAKTAETTTSAAATASSTKTATASHHPGKEKHSCATGTVNGVMVIVVA